MSLEDRAKQAAAVLARFEGPDDEEESPINFITEEGSWRVDILWAEVEKEKWLRVLLRQSDHPHPRPRQYWARLRKEGARLRFHWPSDEPLLALIKEGSGRLETKRIPVSSGKVFVLHVWRL